ncbi:hypothetical protein BH11MYX4_BH11MYX4_24830 [soil metagenome]
MRRTCRTDGTTILTRVLAAVTVCLTVAGCTSLVEGNGQRRGYTSTPPSPAERVPPTVATPNAECVDPSGFGGRGCFRCAPTTSSELLSACTTSRFEDFDNGRRIANFEATNPRPALVPLGPTPPPFEGTTETEPDPAAPPPPPCAVATAPNPVMVLGATGFPMETVAKAMGSQATIFYLEKSSCDGVAAMVLNQRLKGDVVTYDANGVASRCTLADEHPADVTLSALFAASCANQSGLAEPVALPAQIDDLLGPINPVMFTVPATSKERSISAEAAYRVYGFGSLSGVAPWTEEPYVFRRRAGSGNQLTVALSLGLPVGELRGRDSNGSSNMLKALLASDAPDRTLGISSSEIVDTNRDVMKTLAYKHYEQPVAFYPDSDPASLDRRNVRDGHYFLWMPLHLLVRTSGGDPVAAANAVLDPDGSQRARRDAAVKLLSFVMVSRQQAPVRSVDLFGALKRTGTVPQCAMKVSRAKEGAPLVPFTPPISCDCAFEAATPGTTRSDCSPCRDASECSSSKPTCSFGYCE